MNTQVTEGTAVVVFFHVEHAPGGDTDAADKLDVGEVNIAQLAGGYQLLGLLHVVSPTHALAGEQLLAAGLGGVPHFLSIGHSQGNGLFAGNMSAGLESLDGPFFVVDVGGADGNEIGLQLVQHFLGIHVPVGNTVALSGFGSHVGTDVGNTDDLNQAFFTENVQSREMSAVGDHATADNSNTELVHNELHPFELIKVQRCSR